MTNASVLAKRKQVITLFDEKKFNEVNYLLPTTDDFLKRRIWDKARFYLSQPRVYENLKECCPKSIQAAVLIALQDNLSLSFKDPDVYLMPSFERKYVSADGLKMCQAILSYKGIIKVLYRNKDVIKVETQIVRQKDDLVIEYGDETKFKHVVNFDDDNVDVKGYWASITLNRNGEKQFLVEYRTKKQIEEEATKFAGYKDEKKMSPWKTHFDQMAQKTVLRRLCNKFPPDTNLFSESTVFGSSNEQNNIVEIDNFEETDNATKILEKLQKQDESDQEADTNYTDEELDYESGFNNINDTERF